VLWSGGRWSGMRSVLLNSDTASFEEYLREGGYQFWLKPITAISPEQFAHAVQSAQLIGKGGAAFPVHKKVRLMQHQRGPRKYIVINGSEHEPGSAKDRYLLEHCPHKVIEGALLLAHATEASEVIFAVHQNSTAAVVSLRRAISQTKGLKMVSPALSVCMVPDVYVAGEETALLAILEGAAPLPRKRPPFPIECGLHGAPTLVQNVETVAHLPFIINAGASAYCARGVNNRGVTLCTLGHEFVRAGVYEVPLGTPVREVVHKLGGGLRSGGAIKAVQPGGPSSGFLPAPDLDVPLDSDALKAHGSALGCAVIRAYSESECMVRAIGEIMSFFARECCGQCPRCRMETGMLDTIIKQVLAGRATAALLQQADRVIELAVGQGICGLIQMPVAPLRTALALFRDEFDRHLHGTCPLCA
jgi:NADH:ubiquinone oxidoreductase subunit F (NADH-binding)